MSKYSFLCPNGTIFNQNYFICDWWFNFDCAEAADLYSLNDDIAAERDAASGALDSYGAATEAKASYGGPVEEVARDSYDAPAEYSADYSADYVEADAGYAAPAVAHAGVYAAPAAAIAVNPYAYANAYPAAEPYIHQEILAEPYIHDASGEVAPAAEPYIHQEILAEPYIHQEPIAAPVAVAAAPVAYAAAPVAYAAAAPVAAATYAAAAPVATATYGYTTPIATAAYAPAAYSGYYAAAPAVAIAKHH